MLSRCEGRWCASASIEVDPEPGSSNGTTAERRNTPCHELGHALGLNHNTSTTSCLYSSRTSVLTPNSDDYSLLPLMYGT